MYFFSRATYNGTEAEDRLCNQFKLRQKRFSYYQSIMKKIFSWPFVRHPVYVYIYIYNLNFYRRTTKTKPPTVLERVEDPSPSEIQITFVNPRLILSILHFVVGLQRPFALYHLALAYQRSGEYAEPVAVQETRVLESKRSRAAGRKFAPSPREIAPRSLDVISSFVRALLLLFPHSATHLHERKRRTIRRSDTRVCISPASNPDSPISLRLKESSRRSFSNERRNQMLDYPQIFCDPPDQI